MNNHLKLLPSNIQEENITPRFIREHFDIVSMTEFKEYDILSDGFIFADFLDDIPESYCSIKELMRTLSDEVNKQINFKNKKQRIRINKEGYDIAIYDVSVRKETETETIERLLVEIKEEMQSI